MKQQKSDGLIQRVRSASSYINFRGKQTQFKYLYAPFNCKNTGKNFSEFFFYSLLDCEEALRNTSVLQIQRNKNIILFQEKADPRIFWNWKSLVLCNSSDTIKPYLAPWSLVFIHLIAWQDIVNCSALPSQGNNLHNQHKSCMLSFYPDWIHDPSSGNWTSFFFFFKCDKNTIYTQTLTK